MNDRIIICYDQLEDNGLNSTLTSPVSFHGVVYYSIDALRKVYPASRYQLVPNYHRRPSSIRPVKREKL